MRRKPSALIEVQLLLRGLGVACVWLAALLSPGALGAAEIPKVGVQAPDITLPTLDDKKVRLGELTSKGSVVLIVLRGWPGYQCPICDRQAQDFIRASP